MVSVRGNRQFEMPEMMGGDRDICLGGKTGHPGRVARLSDSRYIDVSKRSLTGFLQTPAAAL